MDLKTFVKVNSITNLSDARYCAGMGVHQIGFCLDETNKNYITSETLKAITGWISGVEIVSEVEQYEENLPTDVVEVHSLKKIDQINNVRLIVRLSLEEAETEINTLKQLSNLDYLLLVNNDESDIQIDRINQLALHVPIVLGDGFNSNTIDYLLEQLNIKGIALNGTDEIRPGFKDYDQLEDILEAIEIA